MGVMGLSGGRSPEQSGFFKNAVKGAGILTSSKLLPLYLLSMLNGVQMISFFYPL